MDADDLADMGNDLGVGGGRRSWRGNGDGRGGEGCSGPEERDEVLSFLRIESWPKAVVGNGERAVGEVIRLAEQWH